jgi:formylglycine-generating enzyme required for sulfatase activity
MKVERNRRTIRAASIAAIVATALVGGAWDGVRAAPAPDAQASPAAPGAKAGPPGRGAAAPGKPEAEEHPGPEVVDVLIGGGDAAAMQMAQELADAINQGGTHRLVFTVGSSGAQELADLQLLRGVDLAIVPGDVLDEARKQNVVPGIETTTYVARLFSEELHLLVRPDINKIEDLTDLDVAVTGGAIITAPRVFDLLHVKVQPVVFDDAQAALEKIKSAQVAALAYVGTDPAPLFRGLTTQNSYGLHFLPIPLPVGLTTSYVPRQLTAADYPGLVDANDPILTVGVDMVMVAANLASTGERYRHVADFVDALFAQIPKLQRPPHNPKWREVKLGADFPGWKRFAEAEARLEGRSAAPPPAAAPAAAAPAVPARAAPVVAAAAAAAAPRTAPAAAAAPPPAPGAAAAARPAEKVPLPGGQTFLEMVSLPGGTFEMGSDDDASEKPIHRVRISPFAIARYPVTLGQWRACVAAKACADIHAQGGDDAPMTNLSWDDAQSFVAWLKDVTQRDYRLPSEAEWEYAARAGTRTKYWWGDQVMTGMADCKGCGDPYDPEHPVKVASFPPNPFGLNDMTGSVAEWVADCWHKNYEGAPAVNSPWLGRDCRQHVLRGGSWENDASDARASNRDAYDTSVRYLTHGFRPARSDQDTSAASLVRDKGDLR